MRRWSCLAALPYLVSPAHGAGLGPSSGEPAAPAASERASSYIHWLEERSMLQQARGVARHYSGHSIQWAHPYGQAQPPPAGGLTERGPAFGCAERAYANYPAFYQMVQIEPRDGGLLPPVPAGHDAVNLTPAAVDALQKKGYIVGQLHSGIFYEPGVKDTDW